MSPVCSPLSRVMLNIRLAENNAAPTNSDLQWQPVIGIVAGFLSILLAVYLIHALFQCHASGVFPRILGHALPSGTRRIHSVTESEMSGSWPELSSSAPPPYTARPIATPLYAITAPPRSLQSGPVRYSQNLPPLRRHVDETISRG
ncbi:uncharacterized protein EDB93DRAFT_1255753 [Suillus bovinus]|uniref:uncharacterized protein n=1 Tax=Suillus bovinus TaxID=48563 RepID=UPI001B861A73|nr:uncharacterized protein EDB93DRAFT_1255753 [Suillus bovinus]KAG2130773.1 hypothetical protein EDB93DRAFT_1255753 [Suillus bovinus]